MIVAEAIDRGDKELRERSSSPRLDVELLLASVLQTDRTGLYQRLDGKLPPAAIQHFQKLLSMRKQDYPIAYLLGHQEFFGLPFRVDPRTLIPRAQTEALVSAIVRRWKNEPLRLVDIGTGSGAIAISLAHELPLATIAASDLSPAALTVAQDNAERLGVGHRIAWRSGSLLEPWADDSFDLVVANLPYLPSVAMGEPSIHHEPPLALHGGPDGLRVIEAFATSLDSRPDIQSVILESLPQQIETISYWLRHLRAYPFMTEPLWSYGQAAGVIGYRPKAESAS